MTLTVGITNVGHTLYMYIFVLVCVCLHLSTYCTVSHKMKYKFLQQEISISTTAANALMYLIYKFYDSLSTAKCSLHCYFFMELKLKMHEVISSTS